jgi:hypothetical protein
LDLKHYLALARVEITDRCDTALSLLGSVEPLKVLAAVKARAEALFGVERAPVDLEREEATLIRDLDALLYDSQLQRSQIVPQPGGGKKDETAADQQAVEQVQRVGVRITLPSEQRLPQVPYVMRVKVQAGVAAAQPSGAQVDGQCKAVHLGEQCHDEGSEGAERLPASHELL